MDVDDNEVHEVARKYYIQQETMDHIARQLRVSRSTVSRLLKQARDSGLVKITVTPRPSSPGTLSGELNKKFNVDATVVEVTSAATEVFRLEQVARTGAHVLTSLVTPGAIIGLAWGTTISEVSRHLISHHVPDTTVVQLNGAGNVLSSGIPYADSIMSTVGRAFESKLVYFPVPAFFDYQETKVALWRERSVRTVLDLQKQCSIAVFGVGAFDSALPSHVYADNYLEPEDVQALESQAVVGDVCTVFVRENGSFADIALNKRATGPTPTELASLPRRLCVVSGVGKARALLGALHSGAITDLVVDDATARAVLELSASRWRRK